MIIKKVTAGGEKIKARRVGDAPALGNVQRTSGDGTPMRKRRSARPAHKRKYPKHFFTWCLLTVTVSASILTVGWVKVMREKEKGETPAELVEKPIDLDLIFDKDESEPSSAPKLKSEEAIKIVTDALANRDPGLMANFFVLGKDDKPEDAMDELIRIREAEGDITRTEWLGQRFPDQNHAQQVLVYAASDEAERSRSAQFVLGSDGKWRIDFHAFVRKCDPPLAEALKADSGTFTVRVYVSEESAYRGIYSDKSAWRAYSLTSPDIADSLYAYAKRGSSQDKALRRIIISEESIHHATLGITKHPESGPRQFEVSRVISGNWIVGEKDFDQSF